PEDTIEVGIEQRRDILEVDLQVAVEGHQRQKPRAEIRPTAWLLELIHLLGDIAEWLSRPRRLAGVLVFDVGHIGVDEVLLGTNDDHPAEMNGRDLVEFGWYAVLNPALQGRDDKAQARFVGAALAEDATLTDRRHHRNFSNVADGLRKGIVEQNASQFVL